MATPRIEKVRSRPTTARIPFRGPWPVPRRLGESGNGPKETRLLAKSPSGIEPVFEGRSLAFWPLQRLVEPGLSSRETEETVLGSWQGPRSARLNEAACLSRVLSKEKATHRAVLASGAPSGRDSLGTSFWLLPRSEHFSALPRHGPPRRSTRRST